MVPPSGYVLITSNGNVGMFVSKILHSMCPIDMTRFPFDEQTCKVSLSSWMHTDDTLRLVMDNDTVVDTSMYLENSEWNLLETGGSRQLLMTDLYELTFHFIIRRRPGLYLYVLVLPGLLLSVLAPALFWIPPNRPDRTTLGRTMSV